jgi:hypothetical protein
VVAQVGDTLVVDVLRLAGPVQRQREAVVDRAPMLRFVGGVRPLPSLDDRVRPALEQCSTKPDTAEPGILAVEIWVGN